MVRRTPRTTPTDTPLPSTTLFRSDDPASGALEQRRGRSHCEGEKRGDHQQESDRQPCASASIGKAGIARDAFQQRPAHAAAAPSSIRCEKVTDKRCWEAANTMPPLARVICITPPLSWSEAASIPSAPADQKGVRHG